MTRPPTFGQKVIDAFATLDGVLQRVRGPVDVAAELAAVRQAVQDLIGEAKRLGLPFGAVRQKTAGLSYHLRVLFGVEEGRGHSLDQHLRWAMGDLRVLRSYLGFERVLEVAKRDASGGTLH